MTNLSDQMVQGRLIYYKFDGQKLAEDVVQILAGQRQDFSGHRFGPGNIGIAKWAPDPGFDEVRVRMENIRYIYDNPESVGSFDTAFQLEGMYGSGNLTAIPLDTRGTSSIVEVANVTDAKVNLEVFIYNSAGQVKEHLKFALGAFESRHIIADHILGLSRIGMATIEADKASSVIAVGMHYGRRDDGGVDYMYGFPAKESLGEDLNGSYNTFIDQQSVLRLANPSAIKQKVYWSMTRHDGTHVVNDLAVDIEAHGSWVIYLNDYEMSDAYGTISLRADASNSVVAWLTRERARDYVIVTPVR